MGPSTGGSSARWGGVGSTGMSLGGFSSGLWGGGQKAQSTGLNPVNTNSIGNSMWGAQSDAKHTWGGPKANTTTHTVSYGSKGPVSTTGSMWGQRSDSTVGSGTWGLDSVRTSDHKPSGSTDGWGSRTSGASPAGWNVSNTGPRS